MILNSSFQNIFTFTMTSFFSISVFAAPVFVKGVRVQGSGCRETSARASVTEDGQTLSILFDKYSVEIGEGSSNPGVNSAQKDCRVMIDVEVASGVQYALTQTDYRGFIALPASAYGYHRFSQIVPNQPIVSVREAQLRGPLADTYQVSVAQKPGRFVYSACNQRFQTVDLLTQLFVSYLPNSRDRSVAMINLDSIDSTVGQIDPNRVSTFRLNWRACR